MLEGLKARLGRFSARAHASGITLSVLLISLLVVGLGHWTAGPGPEESANLATSSNWSSILHNPLYLPLKLVLGLMHSLGWNSLWAVRLASGFLAFLIIFCVYLVLRQLFGKLSAFFASVLVFATPWLIIGARQVSITVLYLFPVVSWLAYIWLKAKPNRWRWFLFWLSIAIGLYIPGFIYIAVSFLWFNRRQLNIIRKQLGGWATSGWLLSVVMLIPLIYAGARDINILKRITVWPDHWSNALITLKHLGWAAAGLVWHTDHHYSLAVGRWPLLNITQIVLVIFGLYALWGKARHLFYAGSSLCMLAIVIAGINYNYGWLLLSLPAVAVFLAAGLRYLYLEWRTIFPRNPIPQGWAIGLIAALALMQIWYVAHYSWSAWPNTPQTKAEYMLK